MPDVRQERTGWRDMALSERHRLWGQDAPAVDIDFLLIEYDMAKAVALIEYKNEHAATQYAKNPSYKAMIDLGNKACLPVFAVRYADDFSWFIVTWLNNNAKSIIGERTTMTEKEYVSFLYKIRGRDAPQNILNKL